MSKISKNQIQDDAINSSLVENDSLESEDIKDGTLVDVDISTSAAIQLSKLSTAGATNRSGIYHNGTTWVPLVKESVNFYDSTGGQSFTGTITVALDTARENTNTSVFTIASGEITISKTGKYFIVYNLSLDETSGSRTTSLNYLEVDTGSGYATIPGTTSYGYHRNNASGENTVGGNCKLSVTSGDKIKITATMKAGNTLTTLAHGSSITIIEQ